MDRIEIIIMSVFGLLVVAGLIAGIRQSAARRERVRKFALVRGCTVSRTDHRLSTLLAEAFPEEYCITNHVMQVQLPPESAYLFQYSSRRKRGKSTSNGFACLAERTPAGRDGPLTICTRTPGFDLLVGDRVQAGEEAFRKEFTVIGKQEAALAAVNTEVQHVLLQHAASPGWNITVTIAAGSLVAASFWAQKEDEWEHLIGLATKLRRALP